MVDEYSIVQRAKSLGYQAEVFSVKAKNLQIKRGEQFYSFNLTDYGYGVRVFKDGKTGFAYSTALDDKVLDLAIESAKASKEDKFNVIPSPEKVEKIRLKYFELDEAREKAKEYAEALGEVRNFANVIGEYYDFTVSQIKVVNTEGVDVTEERSLGSVSLVFNFKRDAFITPE
ncbi:MAG: DNA gyrase modulator, partial [Sulfolobaceae archaeon]